jgi:hypothetical protein
MSLQGSRPVSEREEEPLFAGVLAALRLLVSSVLFWALLSWQRSAQVEGWVQVPAQLQVAVASPVDFALALAEFEDLLAMYQLPFCRILKLAPAL